MAISAVKDAAVTVEYTDKDLDATFSAASSVKIALSGSSATIVGTGATAGNGLVTITATGTYVLSGSFSGQILVNSADDKAVRIVLNGVSITNETGPAILAEAASKVVLILADGSKNSVADGSTRTGTVAASSTASSTASASATAGSNASITASVTADEEDLNAAIFSRADLTINGKGSLTVDGNYAHGIISKDDLKIVSGTISIDAVNDGLKGRDLVAIRGGSISIQAKGDGIQTTNDEDTAKGSLVIDGGTVTIVSGKDALHSINAIAVQGGSLTVSAEDDGLHADVRIVISSGSIDIQKSYEGIESANIDVYGGSIRLVSSDDGFNVSGGVDNSSGSATSAASSIRGGMGGMGGDAVLANSSLDIYGGTIVVNANGDGLDSNGSMTMSGGTVIVNGPTANNNGAIDYNGTFVMTGGLLVAAGSAGMAQAPGTTSTQNALLVNFPSTLAAGTLVSVRSSTGEEIVSFAPAKAFQSLVISSPSLKKGVAYTVSTGGSSTGKASDGLYSGGSSSGGTVVATLTITAAVTSYGSAGGTGGGMGGNMGGRKG